MSTAQLTSAMDLVGRNGVRFPNESGTAEPGFDPHLAPDATPLWTILDWTPGGRGNLHPKREY